MIELRARPTAPIALAMLVWVLSGAPTLARADENQPQSRAFATVERYVVAQLHEDIEGLVAVMYPRWVNAQGGQHALIARKREYLSINAIYQLDPEFVELGTPKLVSKHELLFAVVPARSLTPGFPEDIESRLYYLAVSEDRGATWYLLETSCAGAQWAKDTFAGYPQNEISSAMAEPFIAVSTIRPSGTRDGNRAGTKSESASQ